MGITPQSPLGLALRFHRNSLKGRLAGQMVIIGRQGSIMALPFFQINQGSQS